MNQRIVRWLNAAGCVALLGGLLTFGTGCGALAAAANPKVAWALNDPAPMSVVVRRADVAENTAKEVDRLLTETPANDDSAWVGKVAPEKEDATKQLGELRQHDLYVGGARVVAAEVWAKSLHSIESRKKDKPADQALPPAQPAAPAPEPQPVAKKEAKRDSKGNKKAKTSPSKRRSRPRPPPPLPLPLRPLALRSTPRSSPRSTRTSAPSGRS